MKLRRLNRRGGEPSPADVKAAESHLQRVVDALDSMHTDNRVKRLCIDPGTLVAIMACPNWFRFDFDLPPDSYVVGASYSPATRTIDILVYNPDWPQQPVGTEPPAGLECTVEQLPVEVNEIKGEVVRRLRIRETEESKQEKTEEVEFSEWVSLENQIPVVGSPVILRHVVRNVTWLGRFSMLNQRLHFKSQAGREWDIRHPSGYTWSYAGEIDPNPHDHEL